MIRIKLLPVGRQPALLALTLLATQAWAQSNTLTPVVAPTPGFSPKPLLVAPITGVPDKEVVVISVTLDPGASSPPHSHPGDCYATVVEGQIDLRTEGKGTSRFEAGQAVSSPTGTVHQFVNAGEQKARLVTTLVVEKGKPRTVTQGPIAN